MARAKMNDLIGLQNAIMYLDGQAGQRPVDKAKLKPATRMYLRTVLNILSPVMKAYADELQERAKEITGGKPTFETPAQKFEADAVDAELRAVELDIRLPRKKHPSDELNQEENQTPASILQALGLIFEFPKEDLEPGEDSDFRAVFHAAADKTAAKQVPDLPRGRSRRNGAADAASTAGA